jgi:uncharacterized damage-inducible protein DinB
MVYSLFTQQLKALQQLLQNLQEEQYRMQSPLLGTASIGQHVRHTIELAQALVTGYQTGEVNYDKRKRDTAIETNITFAMSVLTKLTAELDLDNKDLQLIVTDNSTGDEIKVATNYFRELAYNSEHTIHHMALIRVALREMQLEIVDEQFGVAPSTLKHRETIMQ